MGRRRGGIPPRQISRQINLDRVPDTAETNRGAISEEEPPRRYKHSQKVPPPFSGEQPASDITLSGWSFTWRVVASIGGLFLAIGVPTVWFAATLYSDVDNLQQDMGDIKAKTQTLVESSIRQGGRLDGLVKSAIKQDDRLDRMEQSITDIKTELHVNTPYLNGNPNQPRTQQGAVPSASANTP